MCRSRLESDVFSVVRVAVAAYISAYLPPYRPRSQTRVGPADVQPDPVIADGYCTVSGRECVTYFALYSAIFGSLHLYIKPLRRECCATFLWVLFCS